VQGKSEDRKRRTRRTLLNASVEIGWEAFHKRIAKEQDSTEQEGRKKATTTARAEHPFLAVSKQNYRQARFNVKKSGDGIARAAHRSKGLGSRSKSEKPRGQPCRSCNIDTVWGIRGGKSGES